MKKIIIIFLYVLSCIILSLIYLNNNNIIGIITNSFGEKAVAVKGDTNYRGNATNNYIFLFSDNDSLVNTITVEFRGNYNFICLNNTIILYNHNVAKCYDFNGNQLHDVVNPQYNLKSSYLISMENANYYHNKTWYGYESIIRRSKDGTVSSFFNYSNLYYDKLKKCILIIIFYSIFFWGCRYFLTKHLL